MAKKITSPKFSFKGFDWIKLLKALEKPLVALIAAIVTYVQAENPAYAAIAGLLGVTLYNIIKYFVCEYREE